MHKTSKHPPPANPKTQEWRDAAHKVIRDIAGANSYIVSDMVVTALEEAGLGLDNYSALGGVFTRAAKANLITKTDETKHSTRGKSHSAKTVWRSLVYQHPAESKEQRALNALIAISLEYNTETVRYASLLYAGGPLDKGTYKRAIADFNRIADKHDKRKNTVLKELEDMTVQP